MGRKGDKLTQDSIITAELLVEKLNDIGGISSKKMFGGHGIFHEGKMFGIVDSKGQAYFKVNDIIKTDFEENGCHRHGKMPYFSIPNVILNDDEKLMEWAIKTLETIKTE